MSTEEQADSRAGLEAQRAAILSEAERRGWRLVEVIEDAGYSGKSLNRPGIQAALDALKSKKADTLVVSKLDRPSRSLLDFAALMNRATRECWALVALDLGVDTTSPAGEAMASVLATFAQFERRLIGQRTKEALAAKKAAGVRIGRLRSPRRLSSGSGRRRRAASPSAPSPGCSTRRVSRPGREASSGMPPPSGLFFLAPESRLSVCARSGTASLSRSR